MNKNEGIKKIMLKRLFDILQDLQRWQSKDVFAPYLKEHHAEINEHKDGLIAVYNSLGGPTPTERKDGE